MDAIFFYMYLYRYPTYKKKSCDKHIIIYLEQRTQKNHNYLFFSVFLCFPIIPSPILSNSLCLSYFICISLSILLYLYQSVCLSIRLFLSFFLYVYFYLLSLNHIYSPSFCGSRTIRTFQGTSLSR